jgi:hypothetical protein
MEAISRSEAWWRQQRKRGPSGARSLGHSLMVHTSLDQRWFDRASTAMAQDGSGSRVMSSG